MALASVDTPVATIPPASAMSPENQQLYIRSDVNPITPWRRNHQRRHRLYPPPRSSFLPLRFASRKRRSDAIDDAGPARTDENI
jgi:hypothetical protein